VLFPTVTFAVFFVVVLPTAWLLRPYPRAWKLFLLGAGWVFYAWWDPRFVLLLAGVIAATHLAAPLMCSRPARQRLWLGAGVAANLAALGFFKYYGFFAEAMHDLAGSLGWDPPLLLMQVTLVVGLSFFTFEAIAYLVELRRGVTARLPLLDLATYLSFFPKLASGPITRPSEFAPQLQATRPSTVPAAEAFWRVGRGLVKKLVVASFLAEAIVDDVFAAPAQHTALEVLAGIYAYALQIYVDFSAYTDIAIGVGLLLGFRLPENFNVPYAAVSVHDFWRRWHMTLSRWVRDFLFRPILVGGRRQGPAAAATLVGVMLLVGLWHGASWGFVVWGGLHGAALAGERLVREHRRARVGRRVATTGRKLLARLATFHFVAFAWVFFRAESVERALEILGRLTVGGPAPALTPLLVAALGAMALLHFLPERWPRRAAEAFGNLVPALQAAALGATLLVADALGPEGVPPFIYFRF
jgi:D-alanyl-lipoteichoic acid acyltransferase DltB (MBOAT superfamily)